ncbi:MAG: ribonuclease III [Phycisphaerae bacterium]|nr:ribonuclease III [Phycisphaerae bacterium]
MAKSLSTAQLCEKAIGYKFKDINLLVLALHHASAADNRLDSNERMEFLGDSVLGLVVCHELYKRFPHYLEGELTKIKSMIVSRKTCGRIGQKLQLESFLKVGKGMSSQASVPDSCVSAAFESVIGAIYIDGGDKAARKFILAQIADLLDNADASEHQENYKSMLQQYAQRYLDATPNYEMLDEKGPDHSKCFEVGVLIGHQRFGSAWGPSKKDAEQMAAFHALQELEQLPQNVNE